MRFAVSPGTFHLALRVCPTHVRSCTRYPRSILPVRYNRYNARANLQRDAPRLCMIYLTIVKCQTLHRKRPTFSRAVDAAASAVPYV